MNGKQKHYFLATLFRHKRLTIHNRARDGNLERHIEENTASKMVECGMHV